MKRGAAPVDAVTIKGAPPGTEFTLEAESGGDPSSMFEIKGIAGSGKLFDLDLSDPSGRITQKVNKIEAITIKQKVSRTGFGVEIKLRKR